MMAVVVVVAVMAIGEAVSSAKAADIVIAMARHGRPAEAPEKASEEAS